jgi:leucyl/phenylalanyl-tRNA---protein transferase
MKLSPELLLMAYAEGVFPMSHGRKDDHIFFVEPEERGIFPLDSFHIPSRLKRTIRKGWDVRVNTDFATCIRLCAETTTEERTGTWINHTIEEAYIALHQSGHAHSIEVWQDTQMIGGLYGVSLRGAFFGESMFSHITDASKVALIYLVARLKAGGFLLLDTQFTTSHLEQFGAISLQKDHYYSHLQQALVMDKANFFTLSSDSTPEQVLSWII